MAALHYKDDHNKAAYLEKSQGSEGYHQILDFLNGSSLRYALTHCPPIVYDSLVRQFWASATVRSLEDGFQELVATVDGNEIVVNESSIRTHLQLDDKGGLYVFTQQEILEGMAALGYPTDGTFTFYKNKFSPQWRYLVHTLIHCLSPKSGGWNQFPSSLASGLICLSDGRKYNFSRLILDGMIGNVGATKHKFLMYPRFLQMILGIQTTDPTPKAIGVFSSKLFANIKLKFDGDHMPLLAAMLPRENMGAGASVPAGDGSSSPPPPLVTPQPSPRTEEVDTTPSIPSPTPSLRPWPTRDSTSASSPQIKQSTPLGHPSPVRQRTPSPARQLTPSPVRQPSPKVVHSFETNPSPFMEDNNAGGDFYVSPNRSYEAPPTTGQPAGGAEEPDALTILSSKLDMCLDHIGALETELKDTKKTLGEDEEGVRKDDLDIKALQVLANVSLASAQTVEAAFSLSQDAKDAQSQATDTSPGFKRTRSKWRLRKLFDVPAFDRFRTNVFDGGVRISAGSGVVSTVVPAATVSKEIHVASTFAPSASPIPVVATSTIPAGTSTNPTAAQSSKGKEQIVEDPTPDMERIFKNMEDEKIGADMAKKVQAEEDAQWQPTLLCPRLLLSNWEYMRTFIKNQSSALYTNRWTMTQVKRLNDAQLKEEFEKIQQALELSAAGTQDPAGVTISSSVAATRTPDVSAKSSSTSPLPAPFSVASTTPPSTNLSSPPPAAVTDTTTTSLPAEPNPAHPVGAVPTDETQDVSTPAAQTISSPSSTGKPKRRKRTAKKRAPKPLLDMDDQSFIKFDSGSESDSDLVPWAAIAAWEVLSTPLGEINALYRIDGVTKHFTTLREILHMVDRQDLMKLYGIVDKFYQTTVATGTMAGIVLYMFVDVPYPLSVKLMERMLKHKLELARDVVGNDLTTAEQLIG
ncbi:hypothetical protein Tco_0259762, partial [Tanacetum coccineum]